MRVPFATKHGPLPAGNLSSCSAFYKYRCGPAKSKRQVQGGLRPFLRDPHAQTCNHNIHIQQTPHRGGSAARRGDGQAHLHRHHKKCGGCSRSVSRARFGSWGMSLAVFGCGSLMPNAPIRDKSPLDAVNAQQIAVVARRPHVDMGDLWAFKHLASIGGNLIRWDDGACAANDSLVHAIPFAQIVGGSL